MPKRPKTPFFQFRADNSKFDQEFHNKKGIEQAAVLGQMWAQLSDEEKKVYKDQFLRDQEEYKKKIAEIEADPNLQAQLMALKDDKAQIRKEKSHKKALKAKQRLMKDLGRPKSPASAYMVFSSEMRKKESGKGKGKSFMLDQTKRFAEMWKQLSNDQKQKFEEESKVLKENYKAELEAWKQKMISDDKMEDIDLAQEKLTAKRAAKAKINRE